VQKINILNNNLIIKFVIIFLIRSSPYLIYLHSENYFGLLKYWVVRKVRADFEGKLKRRRFKFLISFIKFKSFARTFRTTQ